MLAVVLFALPHVLAPPSAPVLVGFVLAFLILMPAVHYVLTIWNTLGQANVTIEKVEALGLHLIEEPIVPYVPAPIDWKRIEVLGVTYAYTRGEDEKFVLGTIDFTIEPGE